MKIAKSLEKRRAQEQLLQERQRFIKDELNATALAVWEKKSASRIMMNDLAMRVSRLQQKDSKEIERRREALKALYDHEMKIWQEEIEMSREIPIEERMRNIKERAMHLKERREKENMMFIKECYDRQWRESCDEIRILKAKAIADSMIFDRKETGQQEKGQLLGNVESTARYDDKLMEDLERKNQEGMAQRQRKNEDMKRSLDEQIIANRNRIKKSEEQRRDEENEQLRLWKQEKLREERCQEEILQRARERGFALVKENQQHLENRKKEQIDRLEEDNLILKYALDKENREIETEVKQKQRNQGDSRNYVNFLREQMVKEQHDITEIEKMRDAETEKIWNKRDEELKERENNRRRIDMEIKESREKQIQERRREEEKRKALEALEVKRNIALLEKKQEQEKEEKERKSLLTRDTMLWNKKAMEEKHQERILMKQQKRMEHEQMARDEIEYQMKIKEEVGKMTTDFPRKASSF